MVERWEENVQMLETLRREYPEERKHWHALQGLRILVIGALATATPWLLGAYRPLLLAVSIGGVASGGAQPFDRIVLFFLPVLGMISTAIGLRIEREIQRMFFDSNLRGRFIERELDIRGGLFERGGPASYPLTLTGLPWLIMIVFVMIEGMWVVLLTLALYVLLGYSR